MASRLRRIIRPFGWISGFLCCPILILLCAAFVQAQDTEERIVYYTASDSIAGLYFLDPATHTTTQKLFEVDYSLDHILLEDNLIFVVSTRDTLVWDLNTDVIKQSDERTTWTRSTDRQFTAVAQIESMLWNRPFILIRDNNTENYLIVNLPDSSLWKPEIAWAHHANVFAVVAMDCPSDDDCKTVQIWIIDAKTGTILQTIDMPQIHYNKRVRDYPCQLDWSPDDQALSFFYPCNMAGTTPTGPIQIYRLDKPQARPSVALNDQWNIIRQLGLFSHTNKTWFDATHLIVGSMGRADAAVNGTLTTYLYNIETEELTPFLDQYTLDWVEMQPGVFLYTTYSFTQFEPLSLESHVENVEIARFEGTAATVLNTMPQGYRVRVNDAGTFAAYLVVPHPFMSDTGGTIGIVSVDGSFSTYMMPESNAHFIGWISLKP